MALMTSHGLRVVTSALSYLNYLNYLSYLNYLNYLNYFKRFIMGTSRQSRARDELADPRAL